MRKSPTLLDGGVLLIGILFILGGCAASRKVIKTKTAKVQYEIGRGAGFYNYAPSAIEDQYKIRYLFLCQNKVPFQIVDHIYLYKGIPTPNGYKWQEGTEILQPSLEGWDKIHVCDPDVREFKLSYKGETYNWIMTYLGVDQWYNHNQIGLAFSKNIEGPYIKYDLNPLITYSDTTKWGVGQSTSIVMDSTTIQLYYSKSGGLICERDIKLNQLDSLEIGKERIIPSLHPNTYFANSKKNRYAVSEVRINQSKEIPTWVGNTIRVTYQPLSEDMFSPDNEWVQIGLLGPENTGFPRNHNPGFLTDTKGYLIPGEDATIYFTVAVTGEDWLWSYDIYSTKINLDKIE